MEEELKARETPVSMSTDGRRALGKGGATQRDLPVCCGLWQNSSWSLCKKEKKKKDQKTPKQTKKPDELNLKLMVSCHGFPGGGLRPDGANSVSGWPVRDTVTSTRQVQRKVASLH